MTDTITIVGVIGTDPEKRNPNGVPITSFRVGSRERRFDRTKGEWVDGDTNWYTVSTYRRLAEHAFESLRRRDRVILTGRLKVRNWENGEKKGTSIDIDADAIGHDLLFGTTTYASADHPAAASTESPARADDAWAVATTMDESSAPGDERALALSGAETPF